jgi:hypothetical protein
MQFARLVEQPGAGSHHSPHARCMRVFWIRFLPLRAEATFKNLKTAASPKKSFTDREQRVNFLVQGHPNGSAL